MLEGKVEGATFADKHVLQASPAFTAFCAFSHSLLISPLAPGQINMITPMLHMKEVRLGKTTWHPQATQVVEPVSGQVCRSWGPANVAG